MMTVRRFPCTRAEKLFWQLRNPKFSLGFLKILHEILAAMRVEKFWQQIEQQHTHKKKPNENTHQHTTRYWINTNTTAFVVQSFRSPATPFQRTIPSLATANADKYSILFKPPLKSIETTVSDSESTENINKSFRIRRSYRKHLTTS